MDLVTLLSVCTLGFDTKIMHGIATVQSHGNPYSYSYQGKVKQYDTLKEAIAAARAEQTAGKPVRIGLMGVDIDLFAATAEPNEAMFEPCVNVNIASRRLTSYEELCERKGSKNPKSCAITSYMGRGYEYQDDTTLDEIMVGTITGNLPNPKIKGITKPPQAKAKPQIEQIDDSPIFFDDPKPAPVKAENEKKPDGSSFFWE